MDKTVGLKGVLQNFWRIAKKYKILIIANWTFLTLNAVIDVFAPLYIKKFFDALALPLPMNEVFTKASAVLTILITLIVIRFFSGRFSGFFNRRAFHKIEWALYFDAYKKIVKHSYSFFISEPAGAIAHKIDKYRLSFQILWERFSTDILTNFIRTVGFIAVVFVFNKTIAVIMIIWITFFIISNYFYAKYAGSVLKEVSNLKTLSSGSVVDIFSNHTSVQMFNGYQSEENSLWDKLSRLIKLYRKRTDRDDLFYFAQSFITTGVQVAVFVLGLQYFKNGLVSIGFFYLTYTYIRKLSEDMWTISKTFRSIEEAIVDAADVIKIMDKPYEINDPINPKKLKKVKGEIVFDNVIYNYQNNDKKVLDSLNLKIKPGEKIGLVGSSGAGKSTFVKLLFRFFDPISGSILIDNTSIKDITQEDLHKYIGFVPQDSLLFHRSIKENILYGQNSATDKQIIDAAKKAHCHEFISKLPNGYDTLVGERGVKLSGGERQRVAIARAILKNAPILILDEATSALDSETETYIQDSLDKLMQGKTVIAIAHRLSTIKKMDRIVVMENGQVLEEGSHDELLKNKNSTYKKLWDMQVGGFINEEETEI